METLLKIVFFISVGSLIAIGLSACSKTKHRSLDVGSCVYADREFLAKGGVLIK